MKSNVLAKRFVSAGLLEAVAEALDEGTLLTVIRNFSSFCESISMAVVERVLSGLFGSQWKKYYEAYRMHCVRQASKPADTHNAHQRGEHGSDEQPWGVGYNIIIPRDPAHIKGCVTRIALETLGSIAANCQDFNCSFLPGDPRSCEIDRIWFAENGRLLWIQHQSRLFKTKHHYDATNIAGSSFELMPQEHLRLDGQVILNAVEDMTDKCKREGTFKPIFDSYAHEIWDLAGTVQSPHPRCLLSTFPWVPSVYRNINLVQKSGFTCADAQPVRISTRDCYGAKVTRDEQVLLTNTYEAHGYTLNKLPLAWQREALMRPVRFLELASCHCVVDILCMETVKFHGEELITRAQISPDLEFLGALVDSSLVSLRRKALHHLVTGVTSERRKRCFTLALWVTCLPRTQILWEEGIEGLCTHCDWIIEKGWLIVHCQFDGTFAYPLASPVPKPIHITSLVGANPFPVMKICGSRSDILVCDGLSSGKVVVVQFTMQGDSAEWTAVPICLSTPFPMFSPKKPLRLNVLTSNYIQNVGNRYVTTTIGDVFDLDSRETTQHLHLLHTCATRTLTPMNSANFMVLAVHEFPSDNSAITIGHSRKHLSPRLQFRLISPQTTRDLKCYDSRRVPVSKIQSIKFSPSGHAAFVVPRDIWIGGWIIVFTSRSRAIEPMNVSESNDCRILRVSSRSRAVDRRRVHIRDPQFLTSDIVVIVGRSFRDARRSLGDRTWFEGGGRYIEVVRFSGTCAETDSDFIGACINGQDDETLQGLPWDVKVRTHRVYKRWIDILQECPRSRAYCRSINWTGTRVSISPGGRFLLYPADSVEDINAASHIEMRDLTSTGPRNRTCLRRSPESLYYYWLLREGSIRAHEEMTTKIIWHNRIPAHEERAPYQGP